MRRLIKGLILLLAVAFAAGSISCGDNVIYRVKAGEDFTFKRPFNASTGYTHFLKEYDPEFLALIDTPNPQGAEFPDYTFKAIKKGSTEITTENKPSWWDDIPPERQAEYKIVTTNWTVEIE